MIVFVVIHSRCSIRPVHHLPGLHLRPDPLGQGPPLHRLVLGQLLLPPLHHPLQVVQLLLVVHQHLGEGGQQELRDGWENVGGKNVGGRNVGGRNVGGRC